MFGLLIVCCCFEVVGFVCWFCWLLWLVAVFECWWLCSVRAIDLLDGIIVNSVGSLF